MDSASKTRLSKVHPLLAERVAKTIADLEAQGMDVRVVQGLRTYAEQNALFAQGRTRKGPKVTNARGGQSNHNFGLAVDLCPFDDGKPDWENDRAFALIGAAGKKNNLEWGGDWTSFPDRPHLQLKTGMKTTQCHELAVTGGLTKVWAEADRRLGIVKRPLVSTPKVGELDQLKQDLAEPGLLDNPPIEQPARPADVPDTKAAEQPAEIAAAPAPQSSQQAENITNVQTGGSNVPADFVPEDKTVDAPPKEGSTQAAATVTVAGIAVPTFLVGIVTAIKSAITDGYVSAGQIGEVVINFISANQKYVFVGLGLIIGNMMLKKVYKQITLWLQMWFASRPDRHNVTVKPQ